MKQAKKWCSWFISDARQLVMAVLCVMWPVMALSSEDDLVKLGTTPEADGAEQQLNSAVSVHDEFGSGGAGVTLIAQGPGPAVQEALLYLLAGIVVVLLLGAFVCLRGYYHNLPLFTRNSNQNSLLGEEGLAFGFPLEKIYLIDQEGKILHQSVARSVVNSGNFRLVGASLSSVLPDGAGKAVKQAIDRVIWDEEAVAIEFSEKGRSGSKRHYSAMLAPLRHEDGQTRHLAVVIRSVGSSPAGERSSGGRRVHVVGPPRAG